MEAVVRLIVYLNLNRSKIPSLLARANTIASSIASAPNLFPSPTPSAATLQTLITALETQQKLVVAKQPGAAALRDTKAAALVLSLEQARSYVQGLCDAEPEQANALIAAAGMKAGTTPHRSKPVIAATLGVASGSAVLVANRTILVGRTKSHVTFTWQSSVDGKTWTTLSATPLAHTTVTGLTPLTTVWFRVGVIIATAEGPWSQPVSLVIH